MELLEGFVSVLQPMHLLVLVVGVVIGMMFGTIPGLSGVTAVALLVPFSYALGAEAALIMMLGVYAAATCAGSLAAILFNIPGDIMAAATARDGYPTTQRGEAHRAISMSVVASGIGGVFGGIMLILIAPVFLTIALRFGPPEYFALAILGLMTVASLGSGSLLKALLAGIFGLLMATVGLDPVSGAVRLTFGVQPLQAGIDFIPAIIGFFAVGEILNSVYEGAKGSSYTREGARAVPRFALPAWADLKRSRFVLLLSGIVGTFVGMLPGAGATIAAFFGYGTSVQMSRDNKDFGKGDIRGVAAPEAANNAAAAGSMVPLLTLGIPGGAVTAILLGVLILNGLRPGPLLFRDSPDLVWSVFATMPMASITVLVVGLLAVRPLLWLLTTPFEIFSTVVLVFAVIGTFAIYNRPIDLYIMFACGVLGVLAKRFEYPIAALVLGLVLGGIAETGLVNGIGVSRGSWVTFFTRPFTMGTLILGLGLMSFPLVWALLARRRRSAESEADPTPAE